MFKKTEKARQKPFLSALLGFGLRPKVMCLDRDQQLDKIGLFCLVGDVVILEKVWDLSVPIRFNISKFLNNTSFVTLSFLAMVLLRVYSYC